MCQLKYNIRRDNLNDFMKDEANIMLLKIFAKNNGLEETDPNHKKPPCRAQVLNSLIA